MHESPEQSAKLAAGGVVVEKEGGTLRVLVVHRPKYDDWSFPKGGVNPGEAVEDAALREVIEETGLECRIIGRLPSTTYNVRTRRGATRPKVVHYFLMERVGGSLTKGTDEVDVAEWLDRQAAEGRLTYQFDRELLKSLPDGPPV
jgi:8-oxo-dGTP pyrophosphatase MutT (NUDIX family)